MKEVVLTVNKSKVYDEVAKTTSYIGAKMPNDDNAYSRIFTTDDDRMMLERFWSEACNATTERLKRFITHVSSQPVSHGVELSRDYIVHLDMPSTFNSFLAGSIESSLHSFFVNAIIAKWCVFTNKPDAEIYVNAAAGMMDDVMSKIYFRKKPYRIIPQ